jgi:hypothetical protein
MKNCAVIKHERLQSMLFTVNSSLCYVCPISSFSLLITCGVIRFGYCAAGALFMCASFFTFHYSFFIAPAMAESLRLTAMAGGTLPT